MNEIKNDRLRAVIFYGKKKGPSEDGPLKEQISSRPERR